MFYAGAREDMDRLAALAARPPGMIVAAIAGAVGPACGQRSNPRPQGDRGPVQRRP